MYLFSLTKGIPGLRGEAGDQGEQGKEVNEMKCFLSLTRQPDLSGFNLLKQVHLISAKIIRDLDSLKHGFVLLPFFNNCFL